MTTVDDYLSKVAPEQKIALENVRKIIKQTVPDAEELISYGMPTFKYKKRPLIYYAAFKNHMSLFPTPNPTTVLQEKLKDFTTSKGTIQFTIEKPLPESLLKEILQVRLDDISHAK